MIEAIRLLLRRLIEWTEGPTADQLTEGYVTQDCPHCGVQWFGHRAEWCRTCGKGLLK